MPVRDDRYASLPIDPDSSGPGPLHRRPAAIGLVLLGGFLGTWLRHELAEWFPTVRHHWPWGTFTANIVGTLILGVLLERLSRAGSDDGWRRRMRLLGGTGFCGGLTTYSTLAVETDLLISDHDTPIALAYLGATIIVGVVVTVVGIAAAAAHHRRAVGVAA